jgi:hypothetical protein
VNRKIQRACCLTGKIKIAAKACWPKENPTQKTAPPDFTLTGHSHYRWIGGIGFRIIPHFKSDGYFGIKYRTGFFRYWTWLLRRFIIFLFGRIEMC